MCSKITLVKSLPHLPGAIELTHLSLGNNTAIMENINLKSISVINIKMCSPDFVNDVIDWGAGLVHANDEIEDWYRKKNNTIIIKKCNAVNP